MRLAIFYHCRLGGGTVTIDPERAMNIMASQMVALRSSGLLKEATYLCIGSNGSAANHLAARLLAPRQANVVNHGHDACTEIPTLKLLRDWLTPGWLVLYHHSKGVTYSPATAALGDAWRICMERVCVSNWKDCVRALENGSDTSGAHWLTPEQYPGPVKIPFWGGTFWWATSDYLLTLPPLPTAKWSNRYEAEVWIGRGKNPRAKDFAPHWPGLGTCV